MRSGVVVRTRERGILDAATGVYAALECVCTVGGRCYTIRSGKQSSGSRRQLMWGAAVELL